MILWIYKWTPIIIKYCQNISNSNHRFTTLSCLTDHFLFYIASVVVIFGLYLTQRITAEIIKNELLSGINANATDLSQTLKIDVNSIQITGNANINPWKVLLIWATTLDPNHQKDHYLMGVLHYSISISRWKNAVKQKVWISLAYVHYGRNKGQSRDFPVKSTQLHLFYAA